MRELEKIATRIAQVMHEIEEKWPHLVNGINGQLGAVLAMISGVVAHETSMGQSLLETWWALCRPLTGRFSQTTDRSAGQSSVLIAQAVEEDAKLMQALILLIREGCRPNSMQYSRASVEARRTLLWLSEVEMGPFGSGPRLDRAVRAIRLNQHFGNSWCIFCGENLQAPRPGKEHDCDQNLVANKHEVPL
jgi:hypothetical protein